MKLMRNFFFSSPLGESIGNENPEIKSDLIDACHEARIAGKLNNLLRYFIYFYHR